MASPHADHQAPPQTPSYRLLSRADGKEESVDYVLVLSETPTALWQSIPRLVRVLVPPDHLLAHGSRFMPNQERRSPPCLSSPLAHDKSTTCSHRVATPFHQEKDNLHQPHPPQITLSIPRPPNVRLHDSPMAPQACRKGVKRGSTFSLPKRFAQSLRGVLQKDQPCAVAEGVWKTRAA